VLIGFSLLWSVRHNRREAAFNPGGAE
jgi:hypothetical protein